MNKKIAVCVKRTENYDIFKGIYFIDNSYDIWDLISDIGCDYFYLIFDYDTLDFLDIVDGYDL